MSRYIEWISDDPKWFDLTVCVVSATFKISRLQQNSEYEKAYQKQEAIFIARKRAIGNQRENQKPMRFVKNVGLGIKTPDKAITGVYVDKKCPFTGNVSIRGRVLRGVVISTKMKRTIIVRRDYMHYIKKYRRFEKRHTNFACHCSPAFEDVKEGDIVTMGQCRPLSKTVRFNVISHEPQAAKYGKKSFRVF